jgi:c-di-GMP-binding flagellar brake protein YcgR
MDQNIILNQLKLFFPHSNYTTDNLEQFIETDELNIQKDSIANTLKGALLDENIVEVQLQDLEEVFFCRILDNPYDITREDSESDQDLKDYKYEKGSYLDIYDHLIITPLEPSMGNYLITSYQKSKVQVLLKVISYGNALEFGCFFDQRTLLGNMPVLKLTFPYIRRKTTRAREFRAKVPIAMNFQVTVERPKRKPVFTSPINISLNGMSLLDPMGRHTNLKVGEKVLCDLQIPNEDPVLIEASIIHVTRLRNLNGLQYCFGVQFNFSKPATKSSIEKIVSLVQRKHLRELSELEEKYGIFYDKR